MVVRVISARCHLWLLRAPNYPARSSSPPTGNRSNRTSSPKTKSLALTLAPAFAREMARAATPLPRGPPASYTSGVGSDTPSGTARNFTCTTQTGRLIPRPSAAQIAQVQAVQAQQVQHEAQAHVHNIQKEAQAYVQDAVHEAHAYVQGAVTSVQQDASNQAQDYADRFGAQVLHVWIEAEQHLAAANTTISTLQPEHDRNLDLEAQQQIATPQATKQNVIAQQKLQADTSHHTQQTLLRLLKWRGCQ